MARNGGADIRSRLNGPAAASAQRVAPTRRQVHAPGTENVRCAPIPSQPLSARLRLPSLSALAASGPPLAPGTVRAAGTVGAVGTGEPGGPGGRADVAGAGGTEGAAPSGRQLGTVDLGVPAPMIGAPRTWTCPFYLAPDATGNPVPRWPVRTAATIRMQSPARQSANTPNRRESPVFGGAAGPTVASSVGATPSVPPAPVASTRPPGPLVPTAPTVPAASGGPVAASANNDGSRSRADSGWLEIGAERTFSVPGACT